MTLLHTATAARGLALLIAVGLFACAQDPLPDESAPGAALIPESGAVVRDCTPRRRWEFKPPGGGEDDITAVVVLHEGIDELALGISRQGREILRPTGGFGWSTTRGDYTIQLTVRCTEERIVDETYTTVIGKRRQHRAHHREVTFDIVNLFGEAYQLILRVDREGAALRAVLPGNGPLTVQPVSLLREWTNFGVDPNGTAWLSEYLPDHPLQPLPNSLTPYYESFWLEIPTTNAQTEHVYPALFSSAEGQDYLLVHEADLGPGYVGTHLRGAGVPGQFEVALPIPDPSLSVDGPIVTPWRVYLAGDLKTIVESDFVQDLAAPSRLAVTSWIRPGAVGWSWWSDSASPTQFERQREYVDYAAARGWAYVLVDEGWNPDWVPELVAYAAARDVSIMLWSRYSELDTPAKRDARLPLWKSWGVAGVKIDFILCDCQRALAWTEAVLRETADLELVVNFHGSTTPRGIERTWPHVLAVEAVAGGEHWKFFADLPQDPLNAASLTMRAFTRNVTGTMDFTPVALSASNRSTSAGFQIATAVVYESGLQHWADSIETLAAWPLAEEVVSRVPTVWDEIQYLNGAPGHSAIIARRHGRQWWIGALSATPARESRVSLSFLGQGDWRMRLINDDGGGGLIAEERRVTAAQELAVPLVANGGYVAVLTPE